jgi:hypothetical protein
MPHLLPHTVWWAPDVEVSAWSVVLVPPHQLVFATLAVTGYGPKQDMVVSYEMDRKFTC